MKIFVRDGKTNFVDDNNVFVGWDDQSQCCCEHAGWFLSYDQNETDYYVEGIDPIKLDDYIFDTKYGCTHTNLKPNEGGSAMFKLVSEGKKDVYLYIFNIHNGYYSHGFVYGVGDEIVQEDYL